MQISHTRRSRRPGVLNKSTAKKPAPSDISTESPAQDGFLKSAGKGALNLIKKTAKAAKPYAKSALITAAPAIAATAALAIGGAPLAGAAILASGAVGAVAGAATWGSDIGLIRGLAGGGIVGMFSAAMGALGGLVGITNMAAIGATREAILRHVADVPKQ